MANTKSALKAVRNSEKKRIRNLSRKRAMKSALRAVQKAIEAGDRKLAESLLPAAYKATDKASKSSVIHKNAAARYKSRLVQKIKSI